MLATVTIQNVDVFSCILFFVKAPQWPCFLCNLNASTSLPKFPSKIYRQWLKGLGFQLLRVKDDFLNEGNHHQNVPKNTVISNITGIKAGNFLNEKLAFQCFWQLRS